MGGSILRVSLSSMDDIKENRSGNPVDGKQYPAEIGVDQTLSSRSEGGVMKKEAYRIDEC